MASLSIVSIYLIGFQIRNFPDWFSFNYHATIPTIFKVNDTAHTTNEIIAIASPAKLSIFLSDFANATIENTPNISKAYAKQEGYPLISKACTEDKACVYILISILVGVLICVNS